MFIIPGNVVQFGADLLQKAEDMIQAVFNILKTTCQLKTVQRGSFGKEDLWSSSGFFRCESNLFRHDWGWFLLASFGSSRIPSESRCFVIQAYFGFILHILQAVPEYINKILLSKVLWGYLRIVNMHLYQLNVWFHIQLCVSLLPEKCEFATGYVVQGRPRLVIVYRWYHSEKGVAT